MRSRSRSSSSRAASDLRLRTLKLTIAYDGTRYAGWQAQAKSRQLRPTIQETLERALRTILREPVRVVASGRTDAGVHAEAQVAHLRVRSAIAPERLLRGVNHLLPQDVAVIRIEPAPRRFHARFDAAGKRYRYRVFTGPVIPPFIRPYVHHVRAPLNVALMRREAAALRGPHDFRAFARLPGPAVDRAGAGGSRDRRAGARLPARRRAPRTARSISAVALRRKGPELLLDIEGNGFLHMMVRSIAGTLIDVGRGRLPPGTVRRMLATGARRLAGTTAPAKGLALMQVTY